MISNGERLEKMNRSELNRQIYETIEEGFCMWDKIAPKATVSFFCVYTSKFGDDLLLGYHNQLRLRIETTNE